MGRIRTIKPEAPQSESLGRVCRDSRLLFFMLFTLADDEGRTRANSRMLASLLFPYDDDAPNKIPEWLMELEREHCIKVYQIDGNIYLQITNWLDHQKIDKPTKSKLPAPPFLARPRERSRKAREPSSLDQGREGIKEGKGTETSAQPQAADTLEASPAVISIPTNLQDEEFLLLESHVREFERTYPGVDIRQQLREMRMWAIANPRQRKTASGMMRFVNSWLSKAQNRSGAKPVAHEPKEHKPRLGSEGIRELIESRRRGGVLPRAGPTAATGEG